MGWLDDHIHQQINSRIVAEPTLPGDLQIFSQYDPPEIPKLAPSAN